MQDIDKTAINCRLVTSRGILYSCDVHSEKPESSVLIENDIDLSAIRSGQTVYIHGSAVKDFSRKLGSIPNKFILVSGDCDESIPDAIFTKEEFVEFIESDKIIHWYSQNCVGNHPKLSKIPIGPEYHVRITSDRYGPLMCPYEQEAEILEIKSRGKPFYEREQKAYVNWQNSMYLPYSSQPYPDRHEAKARLPVESVVFETERLPRKQTYENQIQYAFVACPHGNGLDCHRQWEALVLGCIPIVKTSPIDSLYDELPVLIVQDWSEVTPQKLNDTVTEFKEKQFNYDKLTLKYWVDRIRSTPISRPVIQLQFYNRHHYGDNILNLRFFYNLTPILKERGIQIAYYYDTGYIQNKDELERYVDPSVVTLHPLSEMPGTAIELWMGHDIEGVAYNISYDRYYRLFYTRLAMLLGLQDLNIDTSLYQEEPYLLDLYEGLDPKFKDLDVLVINGQPFSGQFPYNKAKMDELCIRLAKTHKVATTTYVNDDIPCTMQDGLKIQDIGAISTRVKCIIGMASGPITACFNSYAKEYVKKWYFITYPGVITHNEIEITHISSSDRFHEIQAE